LALSLAQMGLVTESRKALAKFVELSPQALREAPRAYPFQNESDRAHYLDGLRKAGAPE
jgi:hypothetical protein